MVTSNWLPCRGQVTTGPSQEQYAQATELGAMLAYFDDSGLVAILRAGLNASLLLFLAWALTREGYRLSHRQEQSGNLRRFPDWSCL